MLGLVARRVAVAVAMSIVVGVIEMWTWGGSRTALFVRVIIIGLSGAAVFSLFEVWPRRLPRWAQRWVVQVAAVAAMMPASTLAIYVLSTPQGAAPFWQDPARFSGWTHLTIGGLLFAPWTAVAAIVRQMKAHDISLAEIGAALGKRASSNTAGRPAAAKAERKVRKPVAPKYRDPESGATWSGRGRTPRWLVEAEKAGKDRASFSI